MIIVVFGAQGSGKGTVAKKLHEELELVHVSTGEIFRENIKNNTELGIEANKYILTGNLVPNELTAKVVMDRLSKPDVLERGAIIDGYPRNIDQCKKLDEILELLGKKVNFAINLVVEQEELIQRIITRRVCSVCKEGYNTEYRPTKVDGVCDKCGGLVIQRADDTEQSVKQRLKVYYENEKEILDYYKDKLLVEQAGDKIGRTSVDVAYDLVKKLK